VNIELDGVELNKTIYDQSGGITEIRYISNISTSDKRGMVEHVIPGMEGNVFQNLGRSPVNISFDGTFEGENAKSNLEIIRSKYKQGTPLPFNSDVSGTTDVTKVLIEDFRVEDVTGTKNRYRYSMVLKEFKEPPPEPKTPPPQDKQAEKWAGKTASETVESLNCLTGKVLDSEDNPKSGVIVVAKGNEGEYQGQTNGDGIYRIENLPPGKYKVIVDSEEYEGVEEVIIIGSGKE
jgi:hypothetical protein